VTQSEPGSLRLGAARAGGRLQSSESNLRVSKPRWPAGAGTVREQGIFFVSQRFHLLQSGGLDHLTVGRCRARAGSLT
jgi:hypothetical protein